MLAAKIDPKVDVQNICFPVMVSPKLDGIRCTIQDGQTYSRTHKLIPNKYVQKLFGSLEFENLDGELILGDPTALDAYRKTDSAVMTVGGEPEVTFWIFDSHENWNLPFSERYAGICRLSLPDNIKVVPHHVVYSMEEFLETELRFIEEGYEGIIVRSLNGVYKQGRSTLKQGDLMKMKRFEDSEAIVVGFEELKVNMNEAKKDVHGHTKRSSHKENLIPADTLGALMAKDYYTGVEFSIGTGFDQQQRQEIWNNRAKYQGKIAKYKFFPVGQKDKPRHPVFLGWRDLSDMSK